MSENFDYPTLAQKIAGKGLVVAIDGPAGAGKSSVAKAVAARLGLNFLDTGAMYRALTWWVLEQKVPFTDQAEITRLATEIPLKMTETAAGRKIEVGTVDVTAAIREERVTSRVSEIAALSPVRTALVGLQQKIVATSKANGQGTVLEGRDTTTVVTPQAEVRILLTASLEERMRRRGLELGEAAMAGMKARDEKDSQVNNFTTPAPGVTLLDTTGMDQEAAIAAVAKMVATAAQISDFS